MTSKQVAALTGVTPPTVRSWVHRGLGPPYYRIVRSVRYKRPEVEAWMERHHHTGTKKAS